MIIFEDPDTSNSHLNLAIEHARKAIELDMVQYYGKACIAYLESLNCFIQAFRHERDTATKTLIVNKVKEYLERVDVLKGRPPTDTIYTLIRGQPTRRTSVPMSFPSQGSTGNTQVQAGTRFQVSFDDIVGLSVAKEELKEVILLPAKFPQLLLFRNNRRRLVLYGPSGAGKRVLVDGLITEMAKFTDVHFIHLDCKDLGLSGARRVAAEIAMKQMNEFEVPPGSDDGHRSTIILIESPEVLNAKASYALSLSEDALRTVRINLIASIDNNCSKLGVSVILSTSAPWDLEYLFRGRFRRRVHVPAPEKEERIAFFKRYSQEKLKDEECAQLADSTDGYSGRDIRIVCLGARTQRSRKAMEAGEATWTDEPVTIEDYKATLLGMRPCSRDVRYEEWGKQFDNA